MDVKEIREKFGLSQQELADKTGIPKDRIAKWEQGKGSPKAQDSEVLKKLFKEYVPRENGKPPVSDFKPQGGQDYKDRYIQLLEELANSNGKQLLQLAKMNQALLKTVLRALAAIQAKGEKRKLSDILIELNNQTEQYLLALRKEGT